MKEPTMEDRQACLLDPYEWELLFTDLHDLCLDDPEAVPSFLAFMVLEPLEAILTAEHGKNGFSGSYTSGLKLLVETRQAHKDSTIENAWAVNEAWAAWIKEDLQPKAALGHKHSTAQRDRASKPRNPTLKDMVARLAKRQRWSWKPKDLWPELIALLDSAGMNPEETHGQGKSKQPENWELTYITDKGEKTLKFSTFKTYLSEARKKLLA